jgi:signal peptidase I
LTPPLDGWNERQQGVSMSDTQIDPAPEAAAAVPEAKKVSETRDFLTFLLKLGIFVFVLRSFVFAPFSIPSESMLPKLLVGDYLIVTKWSYGYSKHALPFSLPLIPGRVFASTPERGDVAVFKAPPGDETDYIKRVIGLPGDLIQIKGGQLFLNGAAVPKQRMADFIVPVSPNTQCNAPEFEETASDGSRRCRYPRFRETLPGGKSYEVLDLGTIAADDTAVYSVPEGHVFMMGDNRDNSLDSRFPAVEGAGIGIVPQENLVGKARMIAFSTDGSSSWLLPWTWFSAARWDRSGTGF